MNNTCNVNQLKKNEIFSTHGSGYDYYCAQILSQYNFNYIFEEHASSFFRVE